MKLEWNRPPADAAQITSRLFWLHRSEEPVTEEPPSKEGETEARRSREGESESRPRGAPEWLVASMEAQRVRRETKAREAREAAERASLESEHRIRT